MELRLEAADERVLGEVRGELEGLIERYGMADELQLIEAREAAGEARHRGDPVTLATIALVAAGAGGALTVAMGKAGFLTQLARVLEKYLHGGQVRAVIKETPKTRTLELEGSARQVERLLTAWLEKPRD